MKAEAALPVRRVSCDSVEGFGFGGVGGGGAMGEGLQFGEGDLHVR